MSEKKIQTLMEEVEEFIRKTSKTDNGWSVVISGKQAQAHIKIIENKKI